MAELQKFDKVRVAKKRNGICVRCERTKANKMCKETKIVQRKFGHLWLLLYLYNL